MRDRNFYLDLLKNVEEITDLGYEVAMKRILDKLFADYTILKVKTEAEVEANVELSRTEKDCLINKLRSGEKAVWIITNAVPWEH